MSKKWIVQLLNSSQGQIHPTVLIHKTAMKALKLPDNLILHFGSQKHTVSVQGSTKLKGIGIPSFLAAAMGLTQGMQVSAKYKPASRSLYLGPLVAVMMSRVYTSSYGQPFASNTAFCEEFSIALRSKGGVVYFITPQDVENNNGTLEGRYFQGTWKKGIFPLPDVVYNRLTSRKLENKASVQQFFTTIKRNGSHIFNEKYLDKTDVFEILKRQSSMKKYLPESHHLQSFSTLKSMMAKYKTVFIKPISGSLGKGIIRIQKQESKKQYICHLSGMNGAQKLVFSSLSALFKSISGKLKNRKYQIQQGISLITANGRPIDFRALVQKNQEGKWSVTSIVARIASNDSFVSNLARGGTLVRVKQGLQQSNLSSTSISKVHARLNKAALDLSKALDQNLSEHFAELGVDLGVDLRGKVWLIEINSKPSKNDNTPLSNRKTRPSVKKMIHYIYHLTRYS